MNGSWQPMVVVNSIGIHGARAAGMKGGCTYAYVEVRGDGRLYRKPGVPKSLSICPDIIKRWGHCLALIGLPTHHLTTSYSQIAATRYMGLRYETTPRPNQVGSSPHQFQF